MPHITQVLLSNDDGIWAPGLHALARAFSDTADKVWVCAPDRERSAASHSLTMGSPLRASEVAIPGLPGLNGRAWAVTGTPADCVKLAIEALLPERPDIVIAGVNCGPNLGTDIIYSGTVAAATEGVLAGIPSMAVSTASYDPSDFVPAAVIATRLAAFTLERGYPIGVLLNVNVPEGAHCGPGGSPIEITRMGIQRYCDTFDRRIDPRGRTYYWLCGEPVDAGPGDGLDTDAVRRGAVSVTPIRYELTDERAVEALRGWDIRL